MVWRVCIISGERGESVWDSFHKTPVSYQSRLQTTCGVRFDLIMSKDPQAKSVFHCAWLYWSHLSDCVRCCHWTCPTREKCAHNVKHTPQQADYKQYLAPLLRWCLINVTGKLCHMPKALVSINTAPGETYLGCQAATIPKTLPTVRRGRHEMKRSEKNEFGTLIVLRLSLSHRCAAEPVQLADWQMGKNSPIWAGR